MTALLLAAALALGQTPPGIPPPADPVASFDYELTGSALRFPFGGSAPVQLAPGAGLILGVDLWPETLPVIGKVPVLTLGGIFYGSVASNLASSTTFSLSTGLVACFIDHLCLGVTADAVAGGSPGPVEGYLAGNFHNQNWAGFLSYTVQLPGLATK